MMADDEPLLTAAEPFNIVDGWLVMCDGDALYHHTRVSEVAKVHAMPAPVDPNGQQFCFVVLKNGLIYQLRGHARLVAQAIRDYERELRNKNLRPMEILCDDNLANPHRTIAFGKPIE